MLWSSCGPTTHPGYPGGLYGAPCVSAGLGSGALAGIKSCSLSPCRPGSRPLPQYELTAAGQCQPETTEGLLCTPGASLSPGMLPGLWSGLGLPECALELVSE